MADMKKEISKIKKTNRRLTFKDTGPSPIRMLMRYFINKDKAKKEKEDINKLIMEKYPDDLNEALKEAHEIEKIKKRSRMQMNKWKHEQDLQKRRAQRVPADST